MKKIGDYAEQIREEMDGALCYAQIFIEYKANNNTERAQTYRKMAGDEIDHALAIHNIAQQEIEKVRKIYPNPPAYMVKEWEQTHAEYVEKVATVRAMLSA